MTSATFTGTFLRRDRSVVLAGLGVIILLSWAYMGYLAWDMANMMDMSDASMGMEMAMPTFQPWGIVDFFLVFIMWTVMQMAMMTPSAAPMVLMYSKIDRQHQAKTKPALGTAVFYTIAILLTVMTASRSFRLLGRLRLALPSQLIPLGPIRCGRIHHQRRKRNWPTWKAS